MPLALLINRCLQLIRSIGGGHLQRLLIVDLVVKQTVGQGSRITTQTDILISEKRNLN